MTSHFLDANIFLELNVDHGDYGEYCDIITDHVCNKITNERILKEVNDIKEIEINSYNTLIRFYKKNIKRKRFISEKYINENKFQRIQDIEKWVEDKFGSAKIQRLEWLRKYYILTVEKRLASVNNTIPPSSRDALYDEISSVMTDNDDAWHVTDAYQYCISNESTIIWSIDSDIIGPKEKILSIICVHFGISKNACLLKISHIKFVDEKKL